MSSGFQLMLIFVGFGALGALLLHGWPKLFTIHIHKHYHGGKGDGGDG